MTRALLSRDLLVIRSASEIVEGLDADGTLEGLPFMPEILPFAGRRFKVVQRAERTCVHPPQVPFPRLANSVVLDGLRCDGSLHGGCQLGCMFFWKESWPRRVDDSATVHPSQPAVAVRDLPVKEPGEPGTFVCQGTELPRATTPGPSLWSPRECVEFIRDRISSVPELASMVAQVGLRKLRSVARSRRPAGPPTPPGAAALDLKSGDWVEVKGQDEIVPTLDEPRQHKGLAFSGNMIEACGKKMRVERRVDTLIEELTGRLRTVNGTVLLEGSICDRYPGCARGMPFRWREIWLSRIEPPIFSDPSR